ncbi:MAG: hypothetical protein IT383_09025 [Deltaproteobacteria bacterium]|nr:hypothetical protein [Deltaproteobacteria bacterium]
MRVLWILPCLLAAALAAGCPPIETKIPSSETFTVPGAGVLGGNPLAPEMAFPADVVGEALAQAVQQSFDTSGYEKGAVKSLKLTALSLTVLEPNQGNVQVRDLGFLRSLAVSLGGAEGEPTLVAESAAGAFDDDPVEYHVPLTGAELAETFKSSNTLEMTADVVPDAPPQFATDVQVDAEITVQIGL